MAASAMNEVVHVKGAAIPKIGCGTWELRGEQCAEIVAAALRDGYRHIDTAQGYANEAPVGAGLRHSGVKRADVFITTKVRPQIAKDGELQRSVDESLRKLGIDAIDLLLIHWPNPEIAVAESMRAMCDVKRRGLVRNIGVSNFTIARMDEAMHAATEPIVANQVEYHPYLDQTRLLAAIRRHGMAIIAYCPIALGKVASDPRLAEIGGRYGKSAVQVTLRWLVRQPDVIAIPRTSKKTRLLENLDVFDFDLTEEEAAEVGRMTAPGSRLINEPQWVPRWD